MTKSLMIPVRPQHAVNILNGKKTLELRKWIPKGYVGWVDVYVTKGKPYIVDFRETSMMDQKYEVFKNKKNVLGILKNKVLNGKVAFRFWFDEFIKLDWLDHSLNVKRNDVNYYNYYALFENIYNNVEWILPKLCLNKQQVIAYGKGKVLYAWHIKKLEIFDEPRSLSDYVVWDTERWCQDENVFHTYWKPIKAPKRNVWVYGD